MRMHALCAALVAFVLPVSGLGQNSPPAGDQQGEITLRKNVNLVNIYFSVKDKHGALLPRLTKDSFELFENGKPQTIKYFSAESDLPLTLGLMVDSSGSRQRMLPEEKIVGADFPPQSLTAKTLPFPITSTTTHAP